MTTFLPVYCAVWLFNWAPVTGRYWARFGPDVAVAFAGVAVGAFDDVVVANTSCRGGVGTGVSVGLGVSAAASAAAWGRPRCTALTIAAQDTTKTATIATRMISLINDRCSKPVSAPPSRASAAAPLAQASIADRVPPLPIP